MDHPVVSSHAGPEYSCLLCRGIRGEAGSPLLIQSGDIVGRNELVVAAVCSHFLPGSPGHVIVVPTEHFENLYTMPARWLHASVDMAQTVALAMKRNYAAEGITLRQNNEPAGSQTAFHFHLHVHPRYVGDGYDDHPAEYLAEPAERRRWARRLLADGDILS